MNGLTGFQIARIRGIPIRIHVTFLLVLPFLAWAFGRSFGAAARLAEVPPEALAGPPWLWGLLVAIALFLSVLVHELAHSLYALAKGGKVGSITLLMIGGVSSIEELPRGRRLEAMMALVGPLASLGLGALLFLGWWAGQGIPVFNLRFALFYLAQLNVLLGLFNLLPAFPMDGGRILRGALAGRLGLLRATQLAATVGKGFAILFALAGLFLANFFLLIIAFFVFVGAQAEAQDALMRTMLGDLRVAELMSRRVPVVTAAEPVQSVADRMVRERRLSFPVVDGEAVAGEVTLEALQKLHPSERSGRPVREVMGPAAVVSPGDRVTDALRRFGAPDTQLAVAEEGRLVGTLSHADVVRALKVRQLERAAPGAEQAGTTRL